VTVSAAPLFSFIVVPGTNPVSGLEESLIAQSFGGWELVVVGSRAAAGGGEPRVRRVPGAAGADFSALLGAGLDAATGDFVAFVASGDRLRAGALEAVSSHIAANPGLGIVYADEQHGGTGSTYLKPVFSPERLRSQYYFGNAAFFAREAAQGFTVERAFAGAEPWNLSFRMVESDVIVSRVAFLALVSDGLGLGPDSGISRTVEAASGARAIARHLEATGGGDVVGEVVPGVIESRRRVQGEPLVSIVIPTRGDHAVVRGADRCLVVEAVRSVIERSTYSNLEIVVVMDALAPPGVSRELLSIAGDRLRLLEWTKPFSFAEKMDYGVTRSAGEFVLFLNDDTEVITPRWIESMLALCQLPGAGMAGAMLYFEDETIQHAGHAYYHLNLTHVGLNSPRGARGPHDAFLVEREADGVTAACSMMPRAVFERAGGFSTLLPGNFNDVDLCMKVTGLGYSIFWTPGAELYHFESKSRDPRVAQYEVDTLWARWEHRFWDSDHWPDDPAIRYPA
jgi:GT2 family glycosyltransferase